MMTSKPFKMKHLSLCALALALWVVPAQAQEIDRDHVPSDERVDRLERRRDDIDGNNVRATITNWTQTAQSGNPGDYWYEWPKNTNRIYVALSQLWVGAELQSNTGATEGETLWMVDVSDFRDNQQGGNTSWTFEPIRGYVNPAGSEFGIAQADDVNSWPPFWPDKLEDDTDPGWAGSWNGFFGKDIQNADQEFFYKAGDDQYDRYRSTYLPDSTDAGRHGMSLVVENRIMAWSQILIDDVVFLIYGVKNDGTEDMDKVGFSIWLADCVGGDCADDIPFFDLLEDVAIMSDQDGIGDQNFGSDRVGAAVISYLETPGNAVDRIDNDGDGSTGQLDCTIGECNSPVVPESFLSGENPSNGTDDNGNGLIDENQTHVPFEDQLGVGYADYIDNDEDGEQGGPVIVEEMISLAAGDTWNRWPPRPQDDPVHRARNGRPIVHLIGLDADDLSLPFRDNVDNDDSCVDATANYPYLSEPDSPTITQDIIDAAADDPYRRYRVPGTDIILFDLGPEDLGKCYADGLDNDGDGAVDEGIDEGFDEMIDESRSDGIDNDGDWDALRDDTGLDGVGFSGDPGDGDGVPTSGAGTDFPGEKNIDATDVAESDQMGITNVRIIPAFSLNFNSQSDRFMYNSFMVPGMFDTEKPEPGDNDLVVSSGIFPLQAGQTERISLSIQLGQTQEEALEARDNAYDAYAEDYQFAQAPNIPTVTAVPGDGTVTLYWDAVAEESVDAFLEGLGLPSHDFEGYRIYRATDPAFLDPLSITDGHGNLTYRTPIAQFDKIDGIGGFHQVDVNGVKFYLGDDLRSGNEGSDGLAHVFVDSTVTNGIRYFYAVSAYDFGSMEANISPTETPIRIRRLPDGTIETGPNVAQVTPTPPVSGYVNADLDNVNGFLPRVEGNTSSRIGFEIVDPRLLVDGHTYRVVFEDTLISGGIFAPDTLTTRSFSLVDVESGETLISRSSAYQPGREFPVMDDAGNPLGFRLFFLGEPRITVNTTETGWNDDTVFPVSLDPYLAAGFVRGLRNPADYELEIVGAGEGQSIEMQVRRTTTLPARPTNVNVYRLDPAASGGVDRVPVDYGFWDLTGSDFDGAQSTEPASFSADPSGAESDRIILFEPKLGDPAGEKIVTWQISLNYTFSDRENPDEGDVAAIVTRKPFLSTDAFEFATRVPSVDPMNPDSLLDRIQVVPNPYVATNRFETQNPFSTGRGPRVIKFINLPPQATVRIFSVSGRLIRELQLHEGSNEDLTAADLLNGTLNWDLQSHDNLTVSYGMYLYHVEAPAIGEKTGTFAIIK
jgi:hypothetical protein